MTKRKRRNTPVWLIQGAIYVYIGLAMFVVAYVLLKAAGAPLSPW